MFGGTKRWLAVLGAVATLAVLPGVAHAQGDPANLSIVVLGDSYSSGNGAGSYFGPATCRRSSAGYARQFEALVEAAPGGLPTTVANQACSGAVTADIVKPRGQRPAQVEAVTPDADLVLLTIGGNDVGFSDIVSSCLLVLTQRADRCDVALARAERMVADGTLQKRLTDVLTAVRAHTGAQTRIVLLGYPYLEGDPNLTLFPTRGQTPVKPVAAGKRVRALTDAGDALGAKVAATLNATQGTTNTIALSTKAAFAGHELLSLRANPSRWFVAPFTDAPLTQLDLWYHPNKAGHAAEAKLLFDDPRVPKTDAR